MNVTQAAGHKARWRKEITKKKNTGLRQIHGKRKGFLSCLSVETTSLFFAAKRKGDDTEQAVEKEG